MIDNNIILSSKFYSGMFYMWKGEILIDDSFIENLYNTNKISFHIILKTLYSRNNITFFTKIYFNINEYMGTPNYVKNNNIIVYLNFDNNIISKKEISKLKLKYMI
ncbi:MAG: hypothetical protein [Caudoviricetes sp.]|nr:MAG: hypothetical protein [Caudoviricetes sp.]